MILGSVSQLILGVPYRGKPDITCIAAGSAAVNGSHYTGQSKGVRALSPATRTCRLIIHNTGGGWRGRRRKETVALHQPPSDIKTAQYWSWPPATDDATPLHQQEVMTTVSTVNHTNVSVN